MGVPTPDSPAALRRIARRQGLIFGGILGIVAVILNACLVGTIGNYSLSPGAYLSSTNVFTYLLALLAFFFAGWRAAQQTGRVDIGGLAGFWAGVVAAVVVVLIDVVLNLASLSVYGYGVSSRSLAALLFSVVLVAGRDAVLALLLGAGLGALGGFIGRTSASVPASPTQASQPPAPASTSSQPAQTLPPPAPQQNQL